MRGLSVCKNILLELPALSLSRSAGILIFAIGVPNCGSKVKFSFATGKTTSFTFVVSCTTAFITGNWTVYNIHYFKSCSEC